MKDSFIGRREFIRVSSLGTCLALYGCKFNPDINTNSPILSAYKGTLPKAILSQLPSSWRFKSLQYKRGEKPYRTILEENFDFLAAGEGWLSSLSMNS